MSTSKKIEDYYLTLLKAILFFIPFLPLYVSPSMVFPYITGKNFAFRILVEIAAAFWLGFIAFQKEYRPKNSIITSSILLFTFIVGLADLFGVSPYNSFWSNYERMEGYITILHLTFYFMIVKSILRTSKDWMNYFRIFLLASVFVDLYALISPAPDMSSQFGIEYFGRVHGTIGNPPFLASYLVLSIFLGLILFFNAQRPYLRYAYLLAVILNSIVIYLTATRGAILSIILGIVVFSLFFLFRKSSKYERIIKGTALSLLVVVIVASFVLLTLHREGFIKHDRTFSRFITMFSDPSVQTRFNAWKIAWQGIKKRPILGWGQENFISVYTANPIPFVDDPVWIDRAHNSVIDWLTNAGFLGFFSYLAIFISAGYIMWKAYHKQNIARPELITIITALICYFIQNLFTFDTINTYLIFFTLLAYIDNLGNLKGESYSKIKVDTQALKIKSAGVTLLAFLIFLAIAYFINYKPLKELQLSRQITDINIKKDSSFLPVLDYFKKALSYDSFGNADVRQKMAQVSFNIAQLNLFSYEGALKFIEATTEELNKEAAFNRYNLEYLTQLIRYYSALGIYFPAYMTEAENLITGTMRINSRYDWLYLALADLHVLRKDYENAFKIVEDLASLHPENDVVQIRLALVAILSSKEEVVRKVLEDIKKIRINKKANIKAGKAPGFSENELNLFAQNYISVNNFQKALYYYKEIIRINPEKNPEKAKYYFEIAKTYLVIGDKENAAKEAKKAAELAPLLYTAEAEKFIGSLDKKNMDKKSP